MKKLIAILLTLSLILCLGACTSTPETPDTPDPVVEELSFTYNGTKIALHAPMEDILAALGQPKEYYESESCAFEGLDKTYKYNSFYIQTYPVDGKDYVYSFWFEDDLIANDEGIAIGSPLSDVQSAYAGRYTTESGAYKITQGKGFLTIIMENDVVTSIQYVIIAE